MSKSRRSSQSSVPRDADALTQVAACDGIELLGHRLRTLLNSPKHDGLLINQYAEALSKLHAAARQASANVATNEVLSGIAAKVPGTSVGPRANRGVLVVPGIIADEEEWQKQMGVYEAKRS